MKKIVLKIDNRSGGARKKEPVSVGIPLPKGEIPDTNSLVLNDGKEELAAQFTPLGHWPDGSLKWVLLDFQPIVEEGADCTCFLEESVSTDSNRIHGIQVDDQGSALLVNTGSTAFVIDKQQFIPFRGVQTNKTALLKEGASGLILTDEKNVEWTPRIDNIVVELPGPLRTTIRAEGSFRIGDKALLYFTSRLHFFRGKSFVQIDFTLWNKGAAKHAGGLWDLGDPGSVLFRELVFNLVVSDDLSGDRRFRAEADQEVIGSGGNVVTVYQDSSGGENWNSANHINRKQQIPVSFRGYRVYQDEEVVAEGLRASPVVSAGDGTHYVSAALRNFWQNFPKAISAKQESITVHVFPSQFADLHELQGGERKTHTLFFDFGGPPDGLTFVERPLRCTLPREWYAETETIPYLSRTGVQTDQPYDDLLKSALAGEQSFQGKREVIDEYGWRNFGEVYADHEAVGHEGTTPLISHYNNQYDQVYGFFREYIATGNGTWFMLMDDLARHVADIDIYYTHVDRDEYNNGLHWHTNHYLDAATCTHRSVSKGHLDKHDPQFYGGGPGMEHCYASGFMYHYYLTGAEASREALLTLADWICSCTAHPETVLGMVNKTRSLLPQWKQALAGNERIRADRFPLTRGTGNPLSALLDAFMLSSDRLYLNRAEELVKGCIHPHDDIAGRDLLNAEEAWSYNVCLQAIGKYLDVKISLNELDYMYAYAQEALLHYAVWMLEHEYPYLEKSDILEYPNETWPAQDLRKSCVFYFAAKHSRGKLKIRFLEKAEYFHHYVINKLNEFETRSLARPIALLMQNRWMHAYFCEHPDAAAPHCSDRYDFTRKDEFWTKGAIMKSLASGFVHALKKTSINKERHWLRCRKGKHVEAHGD